MKYKVLRKLVIAKQWANTEKGERTIVRVLSLLTGIIVVDIVLFSVGLMLQ